MTEPRKFMLKTGPVRPQTSTAERNQRQEETGTAFTETHWVCPIYIAHDGFGEFPAFVADAIGYTPAQAAAKAGMVGQLVVERLNQFVNAEGHGRHDASAFADVFFPRRGNEAKPEALLLMIEAKPEIPLTVAKPKVKAPRNNKRA